MIHPKSGVEAQPAGHRAAADGASGPQRRQLPVLCLVRLLFFSFCLCPDPTAIVPAPDVLLSDAGNRFLVPVGPSTASVLALHQSEFTQASLNFNPAVVRRFPLRSDHVLERIVFICAQKSYSFISDFSWCVFPADNAFRCRRSAFGSRRLVPRSLVDLSVPDTFVRLTFSP
jgi:hypothetical protein